MGIVLVLLATAAYFALRAKQERRRDDRIYEQAVLDAREEYAPNQQEYDEWVTSLPQIYGPNDFNVRVNSMMAEPNVIETYAEYLERLYTIKQAFFVVLERDEDNPRHKFAIRVELSQATCGYLHDPANEEISAELDAVGGRAACLARIKKDEQTRQYSVFLDLDLPLIVGQGVPPISEP